MTAKELAWKKASVISGRGPQHKRRRQLEPDRLDSDGMPMCWELFNRRQAGGWGINEDGCAEAFRPSGRPVMGDQPLSSVVVSWYLPSEIRKAV